MPQRRRKSIKEGYKVALVVIISNNGKTVPCHLGRSGTETLGIFGKKAVGTLCSGDCSNCKSRSYHDPFCDKQEELFKRYRQSSVYLFDWLVYRACKTGRNT